MRQSSEFRPLRDEPGPLRAESVALRAEFIIRILSIISKSEEAIAYFYYSNGMKLCVDKLFLRPIQWRWSHFAVTSFTISGGAEV